MASPAGQGGSAFGQQPKTSNPDNNAIARSNGGAVTNEVKDQMQNTGTDKKKKYVQIIREPGKAPVAVTYEQDLNTGKVNIADSRVYDSSKKATEQGQRLIPQSDSEIQSLINKTGNSGKVTVQELRNNPDAINQLQKKTGGYYGNDNVSAMLVMSGNSPQNQATRQAIAQNPAALNQLQRRSVGYYDTLNQQRDLSNPNSMASQINTRVQNAQNQALADELKSNISQGKTPILLQDQTILQRNGPTTNKSVSSFELYKQKSVFFGSPEKKPQQVYDESSDAMSGYEKRIEALQAREKGFYEYPGFQRVQEFSNLITLGGGKPYEQRSFIGKTAQNYVYGLVSWPEYLAGSVWFAGEKGAATAEGLIHKETRSEVWPAIVNTFKRPEFKESIAPMPNTPEGLAYYGLVFTTAGMGYKEAKTSFPVRTGMKILYPSKFKPVDSLNIKFVEDYTIETPISELRSFEGKEADTIHVTATELPFNEKGEFITSANSEGAGGFRQKYNLLNFYKSSPEPTGKPRAYLAYAGIGGGKYNEISPKVIYGKPTVTLLTFRDIIKQTPKKIASQNVEAINKWQIAQSGATFVPAENIKGMSVEGQFITPSAYPKIPGYEFAPGSIIKKTGNEFFTYYTQKKSNPFRDPVSKTLWDIFGKKTEVFKFDIIEAETRPIENTPGKKAKYPKLEMDKYNEEFYRPKKYVESPGSVSKPMSIIGFDRSSTSFLSKMESMRSSLKSSLLSISKSSLSSTSKSRSKSPSPSLSLSTSSSLSPSPSPSYSPSLSKSPSPSYSPSQSKSPSPSPYSSYYKNYYSSQPSPFKYPVLPSEPKLPKLNFSVYSGKKIDKEQKKELKQAKKYTPTLRALTFNIESSNKPSRINILSGLGERPILNLGKKRKKWELVNL